MGLVLHRKLGEIILIGDNVTIEVTRIRGQKVSLLVTAPREMKVLRKELTDKTKNLQAK